MRRNYPFRPITRKNIWNGQFFVYSLFTNLLVSQDLNSKILFEPTDLNIRQWGRYGQYHEERRTR